MRAPLCFACLGIDVNDARNHWEWWPTCWTNMPYKKQVETWQTLWSSPPGSVVEGAGTPAQKQKRSLKTCAKENARVPIFLFRSPTLNWQFQRGISQNHLKPTNMSFVWYGRRPEIWAVVGESEQTKSANSIRIYVRTFWINITVSICQKWSPPARPPQPFTLTLLLILVSELIALGCPLVAKFRR